MVARLALPEPPAGVSHWPAVWRTPYCSIRAPGCDIHPPVLHGIFHPVLLLRAAPRPFVRHTCPWCDELHLHVASWRLPGQPNCNLLEGRIRAHSAGCAPRLMKPASSEQSTPGRPQTRVRHSSERRSSRGPCSHTTARCEMRRGDGRARTCF
jgi:hypothetical protein